MKPAKIVNDMHSKILHMINIFYWQEVKSDRIVPWS
jgi:hypothetical protein